MSVPGLGKPAINVNYRACLSWTTLQVLALELRNTFGVDPYMACPLRAVPMAFRRNRLQGMTSRRPQSGCRGAPRDTAHWRPVLIYPLSDAVLMPCGSLRRVGHPRHNQIYHLLVDSR